MNVILINCVAYTGDQPSHANNPHTAQPGLECSNLWWRDHSRTIKPNVFSVKHLRHCPVSVPVANGQVVVGTWLFDRLQPWSEVHARAGK